MADSSPMALMNKIASLLISFIYRMTVRLVVELLKLGCILGILTLFGGVVVFCMLFAGWTAYVHSDGSISVTCTALLGASVLMLAGAAFVQYVTKDVLQLTDMTLAQMCWFLLGVLTKRLQRTNPTQKSDQACDASPQADADLRQKSD